MMRRIITSAFLIVGSFIPAAQAEDAIIQKLPVKPDTCYRLSFKAETGAKNATGSRRCVGGGCRFPG
ncbi:MAG: hypothetical protein ISR77_39870 [Pirellulaceae bacterium]|nr:hypothetical protein [Pirellulaceae bacterium]